MDRNLCGARFNLRFLFFPPTPRVPRPDVVVCHFLLLILWDKLWCRRGAYKFRCWMFLIAFHPIFREWRNLVERRPSHEIGARLQTGCLARNFARPNPRYIRTESISFIDKWWLNGSIKTRRRGRHFRDEFGVETTGIAVLYHTGHKKTFIVRHWTHYVTRTRDPSRRDSRTMAR